uniref:Uncharacterized protein n=1 Tax=Arion vulgaris TaxID=1028688 RepID=A0A0B7ADA2_9EUPU
MLYEFIINCHVLIQQAVTKLPKGYSHIRLQLYMVIATDVSQSTHCCQHPHVQDSIFMLTLKVESLDKQHPLILQPVIFYLLEHEMTVRHNNGSST